MIEQGSSTPVTGRQIAKGAAWMMTFKLLDRSIGFISTLILVRLLTPHDFGLVAMATAVVALLELMGAFGFDTALIQRQNIGREHYDTAWTFNVLFGLAVAAFLVTLAVPAASFYKESRLELILPSLALGALVGGFENIGTVTFRKELHFHKEFRFLLVKRLATFIVTIGLAIHFRSYWALVAGVVTGKLVSVLMSYWLHPYRPRLTLSARQDLLHFSKWLLISNFIQFLHSRSTDFILGRTVGTHGLGIYNIAVEIAVMPSTEIVAPFNRAVYPAYSRLSGNLEALRVRFLEVFSVIGLIALPVSAGLVSVAEPAVRILLGSQWLETVPIIRLIAISGLAGALQSNLYLVILALGKPKANTLLSASLLMISLPILVIASLRYGALGAAYTHCGTAILGLVGIQLVFSRLTGIRVRTLAGFLWRPVIGSAVMTGAVLTADEWIMGNLSELAIPIRLLTLITGGATSYFIAVMVLWVLSGRPVSPERTLLLTIRDRFKQRGRVRVP